MPRPRHAAHRRQPSRWPWLLTLVPVVLAALAWQRSRDDEADLTAETRARLTPTEA